MVGGGRIRHYLSSTGGTGGKGTPKLMEYDREICIQLFLLKPDQE